MRTFIKPKIIYQDKLPPQEQIIQKGEETLVIYDLTLSDIPEFKNWLTMFDYSYKVSGGEELKSLTAFSQHFDAITSKIPHTSRKCLKIVAVGGGSIGDFAGFFASVYKRGVGLIQVPTTWLSAIDSAHGGKNALNSSLSKNQVGTFYFPEKVFISKSILGYLPADQILSGYGEAIKTAILKGEPLWSSLPSVESVDLEKLWNILPDIVDYKYSIVEQDPFEESDVRQVLNLGHSLGHMLEKQFNLLHGEAVAQGLHFTLDWSYEKQYLPGDEYQKMKNYLASFFVCMSKDICQHFARAKALELLMTDKKMGLDNELNFIFLKGLGQPFVEKTKVSVIIEKLNQFSWIT